MLWSEREPKLPSIKEAPRYIPNFASCSIFGIARDFDAPLPDFSPLRRRTIHT
jgi:hypothetical protein